MNESIETVKARVFSASGFSWTKLKKLGVVPSYVDASVFESPVGLDYLYSVLSDRLHFETDSWLDDDGPVSSGLDTLNTYARKGTEKSKMEPHHRLLRTAGMILLEATPRPFDSDLPSASQLRKELLVKSLSRSKEPVVGLQELLDFAASVGVPVFFMSNFEGVGGKPDAAILKIDKRPVIAICRDEKPYAHVAYLLAHELGHLYHRHWEQYPLMADGDLNKTSDLSQVEMEADDYAREVLFGDPKYSAVQAIGPVLSEYKLNQIDTADKHSLVLAYLREKHFAGDKQAFENIPSWVKKYYNKDKEKSGGLVLRRLANTIDWSLVSDDSQKLALKLLGVKNLSDITG